MNTANPSGAVSTRVVLKAYKNSQWGNNFNYLRGTCKKSVCKNSTRNTPERTIFHSEVQKFPGRGHRPSPHSTPPLLCNLFQLSRTVLLQAMFTLHCKPAIVQSSSHGLYTGGGKERSGPPLFGVGNGPAIFSLSSQKFCLQNE